eukprot:365149-Chlamydomonas_euryale.AAC.6
MLCPPPPFPLAQGLHLDDILEPVGLLVVVGCVQEGLAQRDRSVGGMANAGVHAAVCVVDLHGRHARMELVCAAQELDRGPGSGTA